MAKKTKRMPLRKKRRNRPNKQRPRSSSKRKKTRESKKRRLKSCKNPKSSAWMKSMSINQWPTSLKSSSQTLQLDRSEASKTRTKRFLVRMRVPKTHHRQTSPRMRQLNRFPKKTPTSLPRSSMVSVFLCLNSLNTTSSSYVKVPKALCQSQCGQIPTKSLYLLQ